MIPYLAGRVAAGVAVIVGLVVLSFFATHYIGDPVFLLADSEFSSEEDREALIREGGFDQPAWEQFAAWATLPGATLEHPSGRTGQPPKLSWSACPRRCFSPPARWPSSCS